MIHVHRLATGLALESLLQVLTNFRAKRTRKKGPSLSSKPHRRGDHRRRHSPTPHDQDACIVTCSLIILIPPPRLDHPFSCVPYLFLLWVPCILLHSSRFVSLALSVTIVPGNSINSRSLPRLSGLRLVLLSFPSGSISSCSVYIAAHTQLGLLSDIYLGLYPYSYLFIHAVHRRPHRALDQLHWIFHLPPGTDGGLVRFGLMPALPVEDCILSFLSFYLLFRAIHMYQTFELVTSPLYLSV